MNEQEVKNKILEVVKKYPSLVSVVIFNMAMTIEMEFGGNFTPDGYYVIFEQEIADAKKKVNND